MIPDSCQDRNDRSQSEGYQTCDSGLFFENLIWLTTKEAARYLRKSTYDVRVLVYRKILRYRKFRRRLYFKREELDALIETSQHIGGL